MNYYLKLAYLPFGLPLEHIFLRLLFRYYVDMHRHSYIVGVVGRDERPIVSININSNKYEIKNLDRLKYGNAGRISIRYKRAATRWNVGVRCDATSTTRCLWDRRHLVIMYTRWGDTHILHVYIWSRVSHMYIYLKCIYIHILL